MSPPARPRAERTPMNERGIAPLDAARMAQRAIPTKDSMQMHPAPRGINEGFGRTFVLSKLTQDTE